MAFDCSSRPLTVNYDSEGNPIGFNQASSVQIDTVSALYVSATNYGNLPTGRTDFSGLDDTPGNYGSLNQIVVTNGVNALFFSTLEFPPGGSGVTDHGDLTGLDDSDDHPQYIAVTPSEIDRNVIKPTINIPSVILKGPQGGTEPIFQVVADDGTESTVLEVEADGVLKPYEGIDMTNKAIINLVSSTNANSAATKQQMEDHVDASILTEFSALTDTPDNYGNDGEFLIVSGGEVIYTGVTPGGGVTHFSSLDDTPPTHAGHPNEFVVVSNDETELLYSATSDISHNDFGELTDGDPHTQYISVSAGANRNKITITDASEEGLRIVANAAQSGPLFNITTSDEVSSILVVEDNGDVSANYGLYTSTAGENDNSNHVATTEYVDSAVTGAGGANTFDDLNDTPDDYIGAVAGDFVVVSGPGGDGLEFLTNSILSILDTPATWGSEGDSLVVNSTTNGLEWSAVGGGGGVTDFTGLDDTPDDYGTSGQVVYTSGDGLGYKDLNNEYLRLDCTNDPLTAQLEVPSVSSDFIQFDTTYTDGTAEGKLQWNSDDGTLEVGMPGGNVNLQIGQEMLVRVRNQSGSNIPNGALVYFTGSTGVFPTIDLATAASSSPWPSAFVQGWTTEPIDNNDNGFITTKGLVRGVDTSLYSNGDEIYLSVTAGEFTNVPPEAPNALIAVGTIIKADTSANDGMLYSKITPVPLMQQISNVKNVNPSVEGDFLRWNSTNSRYELSGDASIDHSGINLGGTTINEVSSIDDHVQYIHRYPDSRDRNSIILPDGATRGLAITAKLGASVDPFTIFSDDPNVVPFNVAKNGDVSSYAGFKTGINPTIDTHVTNKLYVDQQASAGIATVPMLNAASIGSPNLVVSSTGSNVELWMEHSSPPTDLQFFFSGYPYTISSPTTVTLTAGTDESPELNFVYVTESGGSLTLEHNTTGWPTNSHAPVATVLCQSVTSVGAIGAYKVHAWTDHVNKDSENGHLAHINKKLRALPATWIEGCAAKSIVGVDLGVETGTVFQLHEHNYPALDTSTVGDVFIVKKHSTTFNLLIDDLSDITLDATGGSVNNRHVPFVVWGVVNEKDEDCKVFINLPFGTYASNKETEAIKDIDNYADYEIPLEYRGVGFLIAKYTALANTGGSWTQVDLQDLRGKESSVSPGGAGTLDHSQLSNLDQDNHLQYIVDDPNSTRTNIIEPTQDDVASLVVKEFDTGRSGSEEIFQVQDYLGATLFELNNGEGILGTDLNAGANNLYTSRTPLAASDLTRKGYVDSEISTVNAKANLNTSKIEMGRTTYCNWWDEWMFGWSTAKTGTTAISTASPATSWSSMRGGELNPACVSITIPATADIGGVAYSTTKGWVADDTYFTIEFGNYNLDKVDSFAVGWWGQTTDTPTVTGLPDTGMCIYTDSTGALSGHCGDNGTTTASALGVTATSNSVHAFGIHFVSSNKVDFYHYSDREQPPVLVWSVTDNTYIPEVGTRRGGAKFMNANRTVAGTGNALLYLFELGDTNLANDRRLILPDL